MLLTPIISYQLKAGHPAKSGNCAGIRKLLIAGLLPNSETSESELLSRLKLVALLSKEWGIMSNNLNNKGYLAKIEFDAEDRIVIGRIIGISDVIGFHGESVAELEEAFHEAVDNYLAACGKSITLKPAEKSFRQGWKEVVNGETMPVDELWTD